MKKFSIIGLMVVLLLSSVGASQLLVRTYYSENNVSLLDLKVIENSTYYSDYYSVSQEEPLPYIIQLADSEGNTLYQKKADFLTHTLFEYGDTIASAKKLSVYFGEEIIYEGELNLCDSDEICEPCASIDCTTNEDQLSCGDCRESSEDNFCNVKDDSICDPDCVIGYAYEEEPLYEGCFEETLLNPSCAYYNLEECEKNEKCVGTEQNISGKKCCTLCEKKEKEDYYEDIDIDKEPEPKKNNYTLIIVVSVIILLLAL